MKENLYKNAKNCEPKGLSPEAVKQYYWEQGWEQAFDLATERLTFKNQGCPACDCNITVKGSFAGCSSRVTA